MAWQPREIMNQRTEFALKALQTDNFRALCREYGISPKKIGYKWLARFKEESMGGMGDQSRRPRSSPESLGEEAICRIINSRNDTVTWGPRKIREVYLRQWGQGPSESSLKRVLERCGLTEKRKVQRWQEAVGWPVEEKRWLRMRCGRWISKAGGMIPMAGAIL